MKRILDVLLDDFAQLRGNIIAIVIICGLVILPSFYVWFSLLAFWNPEDSTGNLDVAVANVDAGYQSDLIPTRIDAGAQVVDDLRANTKFHWVFVDEAEAVDGVKSGKYYAAIVIPESFSRDLVSVFSASVTNPVINYYVNEKINPIAPHLTSIGASTLQEDIDQAFTSTVSDIALSTNSNLVQFMEGNGLASYAGMLVNNLATASGELEDDANQVRAFSALVSQTLSLAQLSSQALEATGTVTQNIVPLVQSTREGIEETTEGTDEFVNMAEQSLQAARSSLVHIQNAANQVFATMKDDPATIRQAIAGLQSSLVAVRNAYEQARSEIEGVDPSSPLINTIDQAIVQINRTDAALANVSNGISADAADVESAQAELSATIDAAITALDDIQSGYASQLEERTENLVNNLNALGGGLETMAGELKASIDALADSAVPFATGMSDIRDSLDTTARMLEDSAAQIDQSRAELERAMKNNDLAEVRRIIGDDPSGLAKTLSAPTGVAKHPVYPVANYGSAMSPFYTSLGLFIAAIFIVIILKTQLTPERREKLGNPSDAQEYVGHGLFLLLVALAQATLLCTGNLFFLEVQCDSIALYYLTGLTTEFVFFSIVYALVIAFGNIGKAIAVILLVMQVAGSGGELPIQLSSQIFQDIYPWLPFTHSMNLFQGAVAGIYGNQYLVSYLILLAFAVPAFLLGLVLRKPLGKLNDFIDRQLEKTGVM